MAYVAAKPRVVAKWFPTLGYWSIVHERSHQNAFRSAVNRFCSAEAARQFAAENGCVPVVDEATQ